MRLLDKIFNRLVVVVSLMLLQAGCIPTKFADRKLWNPFAQRQSGGSAQFSRAPDVQKPSNAHLIVGRALEKEGEVDRAIAVYTQLLETNPHSVTARHRLAVLLDRKGDGKEAERLYQHILKSDDNNAEVLCDYGYSQMLQGHLGQAESLLRQAISLAPDLSRAHNNLALVLVRTGRHDEAVAAFRSAGSDETRARANLNYALLWFDNREEAERLLQITLRSNASPNAVRQVSFAEPQPVSLESRPTKHVERQSRQSTTGRFASATFTESTTPVEKESVAVSSAVESKAPSAVPPGFFDRFRAILAERRQSAPQPAVAELPDNPLRSLSPTTSLR